MTRARWGRRLSTGSAVASATLPWLADWNHGHTFGPEYGPHARWHGTSEVLGATTEGVLALWLVRTRAEVWRKRATTLAAQAAWAS